MSEIAGVANSVFNAFAFAGAGWIFSKFNHTGYTREMKRHNLALEKLAKDREIWNEKRLSEIDRVNDLRYNQKVGELDVKDTNDDLDYFAERQKMLSKVDEKYPKPKIDYKPSNEMQKYITFVKYLTGIVVTSAAAFII